MNPQPHTLPPRAGIGLRAEHHAGFVETRPDVAFIEAHSENYFGRGGKPLHYLERARRDYPLSLHGVGLSIGSADPLNEIHLERLGALVERMQPTLVSEHLCWSSAGGVYANDLLPLPRTREAIAHVVARVQKVQERLRRTILLENVSSYFEFADSALPEAVFITEIAWRSGCGILLDVNNVFVSAHNHGFDADEYLETLPRGLVREIHLAGFETNAVEGGTMLIDTHSRPVAAAVWSLYERALERFGPVPTLIEWDTNLPPLATLIAEAHKADAMLARADRGTRHDRAA